MGDHVLNILLVSPRTPDTFWSFKHALRFISKRAAFPPLGLITVAGMLPREWSYKLVDLNVARLADADITWADYVLISAMMVHKESVESIARRCRQAGKPTIAGGPLFSPAREEFPDIDHFVIGECEELVEDLIRDMRKSEVKPLYRAKRFPDLIHSPIPRWDLIRMRDYASMSVQATRGCPFDCEFCDIVALNGRVPRHKSPQRFIAELDALRLHGWQDSTFLVDDNFIGNRKQAKELLRAMIGWRRDSGTKMTFLTEASVNMASDPELLHLMAEAGFKKVFLGIETPNTESLQECHKIQNTRCDLISAVQTIQSAGIEVMGGFIVGFDNDESDIFERQFEFIQQAGVVTAMVGLLQALPRSRLYQRLVEEGRILGESLGDNTRAAFNFEPKLDKEFLTNNYRKLMQRLYEPRAYYQRVQSFLERYKQAGPRVRIAWSDVTALFKSLWLMGVVHRGRRAYWRFFAWALLRHRAQFGLAITLTIYGYHFRKVASTL
jgi:radical SAM superfamily enzyme YgiQ (UPF0313 family)